VRYSPPAAAGPAFNGVIVTVHYELYDGMPVLRKWVTVNVASSGAPLEVSSLAYELLRSPNFSPERMTVVRQQSNNPTPDDQQVAPDRSASFPGREQQLWYQDPQYDLDNDREIHVTYTLYTVGIFCCSLLDILTLSSSCVSYLVASGRIF
jgi:hypothetical protein